MKTLVKEEADLLIVSLAGKLDAVASPEVGEKIQAAIRQEPRAVIIDLSDVPFVSSAGLRVLVKVAKLVKPNLFVSGVRPTVREIFELSGLDRIMSFSDSVESARQTITPANAIQEVE